MRAIISGIIALMFLISCRVTVISHEEELAAKSAIDFAKVALIRQDIQHSYSLLSDNAKKTTSFENYSQILSKIHLSSYPISLTAEEYEPIPGQEGMNVFLYGENGSEKFFYRLIMEGTARKGYKVSGIYRGNGPYPPSNLRKKLKIAYST
jgi:hypothetical protein